MKNDNTPVDIDFAEAAVPHYARRGIVTMFMIMLGFTFFSASMWVGKELADGLDFGGFIISMIIGGLILSLYTGLLGYVGAETGMSLDLLARKAFGAKGSYLPSAMISFTQIGWFGVGIAMFADPVQTFLKANGCNCNIWIPIIIAGVLMTSSAYWGIKALTVVSVIAVRSGRRRSGRAGEWRVRWSLPSMRGWRYRLRGSGFRREPRSRSSSG